MMMGLVGRPATRATLMDAQGSSVLLTATLRRAGTGTGGGGAWQGVPVQGRARAAGSAGNTCEERKG